MSLKYTQEGQRSQPRKASDCPFHLCHILGKAKLQGQKTDQDSENILEMAEQNHLLLLEAFPRVAGSRCAAPLFCPYLSE